MTIIGFPLRSLSHPQDADAAGDRDRGAWRDLRPQAQRRAVRGSELRVFAIGALVNGTVALLGPIIGVVMMFVTSASLGFINLVSALV